MKRKRMKKKHYRQGIYAVKNPHKYIGDPKKCEYRSSWERKVFARLDEQESVIGWGAEPFPIWYVSPKDGRKHRYFPDVIVVARGVDGQRVTTLIEIKPYKEQFEPAKQGKTKARYIQECITYSVNQAKWEAARALCKKKGWHFKVMTEKEINPKLGKKK